MMKIEFTKEQLIVIDKALQQLPYYMAAPIFAHINKEVQKNFDEAADRATPSGQVLPTDQFAGD